MFTLDPEVVRAQHPRLGDVLALRRHLDPQRVFGNAFVDRLLGDCAVPSTFDRSGGEQRVFGNAFVDRLLGDCAVPSTFDRSGGEQPAEILWKGDGYADGAGPENPYREDPAVWTDEG